MIPETMELNREEIIYLIEMLFSNDIRMVRAGITIILTNHGFKFEDIPDVAREIKKQVL